MVMPAHLVPKSEGIEMRFVAQAIGGKLIKVHIIFVGDGGKGRREDEVEQEALDPILILLI